jgi:transposase-like protein
MNLVEISNKFPSEYSAIKYFEKVRWKNKPVCPYCKSMKVGKRRKDNRFNCNNCNKSFSVTTNTNIHNTRLPLKTWLYAFALITDAKKRNICKTGRKEFRSIL